MSKKDFDLKYEYLRRQWEDLIINGGEFRNKVSLIFNSLFFVILNK